MRKFKLYEDNAEVAGEAMRNFLYLLNSKKSNEDFLDIIKELDKTERANMYELYKFYRDGLINADGAFCAKGVDLSKPLSNEDVDNLITSTSTFDKLARLNGWVIDTQGNAYAVKNHANFLNFMTLFGVDCSSYIRVTNAPIGLARLNFSSAAHYIDTNKPHQITKEQVQALYNIKTINEKRFGDANLPFKDYIIDSMLGGSIVNSGSMFSEDNLKVIAKYSPEPISANELMRDYHRYSKYKDLYEEDYGRELRI